MTFFPGTVLTKEENRTLEEMIKKLKSAYGWDESLKFLNTASQNCSEMLIYLGDIFYKVHLFQVIHFQNTPPEKYQIY